MRRTGTVTLLGESRLMRVPIEEISSEKITSNYWRNRHLTPEQLLVHDIRYESRRAGREPRLEVDEVPISSIIPDAVEPLKTPIPGLNKGINCTRSEQQRIDDLHHEYGWMSLLRKDDGRDKNHMCRWIHVSSKFTEFLQGSLLGLSDWSNDPEMRLESLRQLDRCVYENERFSFHGKYFSPFCHPLVVSSNQAAEELPLLISLSFLDWTTFPGPTPPLRFQIDKREGYASSRTSSHPLRTIFQHYYRLENTSDREKTQVYTRHRPWTSNRETDLKVRRWYGHYPSGLNVDELWILVIDSTHIITFSSNQTWKSRHPPLQFVSRVAEVSFRGVRNNYSSSETHQKYTAMSHAVACIHSAVGMLHRGFWQDMPLPCTDRYGSYLGHLQYRLYRAPSTKLVMDLLQLQDELHIILQLSKKQDEVLTKFKRLLDPLKPAGLDRNPAIKAFNEATSLSFDSNNPQTEASPYDSSLNSRDNEFLIPRIAPPSRLRYTFRVPTPIDEVIDHLRREYDDLKELHANSNDLVTRTIQLVNIRLEDHGQAILIFTIVTIIFLPLSFVASFFGMNVSDIRAMDGSQKIFWISGISLTVVVLVGSTLLAFYGSHYWDKLRMWKDSYSRQRFLDAHKEQNSRYAPTTLQASSSGSEAQQAFRVLDARRVEGISFQ